MTIVRTITTSCKVTSDGVPSSTHISRSLSYSINMLSPHPTVSHPSSIKYQTNMNENTTYTANLRRSPVKHRLPFDPDVPLDYPPRATRFTARARTHRPTSRTLNRNDKAAARRPYFPYQLSRPLYRARERFIGNFPFDSRPTLINIQRCNHLALGAGDDPSDTERATAQAGARGSLDGAPEFRARTQGDLDTRG